MGNCCGMQSSKSSSSWTVWAEDEWGPKDKEGLLDGGGKSFSVGGSTTRDQVTIRITKKQLEELLRKADDQVGGGAQKTNLRANKILQSLIDESDHFEIQHQRSWRPALQSIPEID